MHSPDIYEQSNGIHRRDVSDYLTKLIPRLKWKENNNRIIDIGCGDGSVTNILKKYIPKECMLTGCDISESMVAFAANRYCNEQISFLVLDIASDLPPHLKGTFDHVFSFYAINWIIDQQRAFENIFNLLDDGGQCGIILVAYNPVFDVYRTLAKDRKWMTWVYDVEKYISPYHDTQRIAEPSKEITALMKRIGFVDVDVESQDKVFVFRDEKTRMNLMTAICPFEVSKDLYDEFMQDYIKVLNEIETGLKIKENQMKMLEEPTLHYESVTIYGRKPSKDL